MNALLLAAAVFAAEPQTDGTVYQVETKIMSAPTTQVRIAAEMRKSPVDAAGLLNRLTKEKGVDLLSAPRITVRAHSPAQVRVVGTVSYFAARPDGLYELKTCEPGITLDCVVAPKGAGEVELESALVQLTIQGRKPVPGVTADVGEPTLQRREIKTRVTTKLGSWVLLGGTEMTNADDSRSSLLVFTRVTEVKP